MAVTVISTSSNTVHKSVKSVKNSIMKKGSVMRDFLRLLIVVSSFIVLAFGVLELIGYHFSYVSHYRHEQTKSISAMIVGIVLVTHGVAGISAAVSLVEWFIGTYSIMTVILTGLIIPKVAKFEQMDWSPESLKRLSRNLEGYLKSVDPVMFKELLITVYDLFIVILVSLIISFVSSLALFYVVRSSKNALLKKNVFSSTDIHRGFSNKAFNV